MIRQARRSIALATIALAGWPCVSPAQDSSVTLAAGARAIGLLTYSSTSPGGRALTEAYLTQPVVSAGARAHWLHATGMLNLEGLTLRRGELDLGAWGEGYVDRRHPHAYLHQLMIGAESRSDLVAGSLYLGRGFVPFGSDDPMTRPFVSYPVDHHLAQILERLTVVGAARKGVGVVEAAAFGGDEPIDPSTLPLARRFGDSWSVRATLVGDRLASLLGGVELAASYANVKSPEYREGQGLDQRKAHVALRYARDNEGLYRYALFELARTTDIDRGRSLYSFDAALGEGAMCRRNLGLALRWERSGRPEEERLVDLFRSARPATDVSILGITRWTTLTGAASLPSLALAPVRATPFVELARVTPDRTTAAVFDPVRFYGSNPMWRASAGLRLGIGAAHDHGRMGRYGAASDAASMSMPSQNHSHHQENHCFS